MKEDPDTHELVPCEIPNGKTYHLGQDPPEYISGVVYAEGVSSSSKVDDVEIKVRLSCDYGLYHETKDYLTVVEAKYTPSREMPHTDTDPRFENFSCEIKPDLTGYIISHQMQLTDRGSEYWGGNLFWRWENCGNYIKGNPDDGLAYTYWRPQLARNAYGGFERSSSSLPQYLLQASVMTTSVEGDCLLTLRGRRYPLHVAVQTEDIEIRDMQGNSITDGEVEVGDPYYVVARSSNIAIPTQTPVTWNFEDKAFRMPTPPAPLDKRYFTPDDILTLDERKQHVLPFRYITGARVEGYYNRTTKTQEVCRVRSESSRTAPSSFLLNGELTEWCGPRRLGTHPTDFHQAP